MHSATDPSNVVRDIFAATLGIETIRISPVLTVLTVSLFAGSQGKSQPRPGQEKL